jgi:transcriptional regulator with XRE-family HTH domain
VFYSALFVGHGIPMEKDEKSDLLTRLASSRGEAVRAAREALGMTQVELADRASTSQQTIDRIERGVVEHSRAYPRIAKVLNIPDEGFDYDRTVATINRLQMENDQGYKAFMEEGRIASMLTKGGMIPLITTRMGRVRLVNAIPRGYPVEFAQEAFAITIFGDEMEPVLRAGDIAIANPVIPPWRGCEVCCVLSDGIIARTLVGETEETWQVQTWNPQEKTPINKNDASVATIVAKISRSH